MQDYAKKKLMPEVIQDIGSGMPMDELMFKYGYVNQRYLDRSIINYLIEILFRDNPDTDITEENLKTGKIYISDEFMEEITNLEGKCNIEIMNIAYAIAVSNYSQKDIKRVYLSYKRACTQKLNRLYVLCKIIIYSSPSLSKIYEVTINMHTSVDISERYGYRKHKKIM